MFPFWFVLAAFTYFTLVGAYRGNLFKEESAPIAALSAAVVVVTYVLNKNNYIKIADNLDVTVSGHGSWSKVYTRIPEIKYILRIPQYAIKSFGAKMMIYVEDGGGLKHIQVKEFGMSDVDIRDFLQKIKSINPNVVLDSEYEEFLSQPVDANRNNRFRDSTTKNSVASVEKFLRERGEELN